MAGTIATLNVSVKAVTKDFRKGMKSALRDLREFKDDVIDTSKQVTKYGIALTAAVAAGLAYFTKKHMESIDETAKFADTVNMGVAELNSYRDAVDMAGASAEEFDKVISKMNANIGDALKGGAAAKMFEDLGLSAKSLSSMSAGQALNEIADKISKLPTSFQRANAEVEIFGKTGQRMATFLELGAEGIRKATDETRELRMEVSRVDAAAVEAANDSFSRFKIVLGGIGDRLAVEISPYLLTINNELIKTVPRANDMGRAIHNAITESVKAVKVLLDGINDIMTGMAILGNMAGFGFGGLSVAVNSLGAGVLETSKTLLSVMFPVLNFKSLYIASLATGSQNVAESLRYNAKISKGYMFDRAQAVGTALDDGRQRRAAIDEGFSEYLEKVRENVTAIDGEVKAREAARSQLVRDNALVASENEKQAAIDKHMAQVKQEADRKALRDFTDGEYGLSKKQKSIRAALSDFFSGDFEDEGGQGVSPREWQPGFADVMNLSKNLGFGGGAGAKAQEVKDPAALKMLERIAKSIELPQLMQAIAW